MCDVLQLVGDAGAQPASNHVCDVVRESRDRGFNVRQLLRPGGKVGLCDANLPTGEEGVVLEAVCTLLA